MRVGRPPGRPDPPPPGDHSVATLPPEAANSHDATTSLHWAALAAVILLAVLVRLKEPMSSSIIGAEDPYLFMERTWNLLQGWEIWDYPVPGFMMFLAPFALLGPDAFYWTARFLPVAFGAAAAFGTFLLVRHDAGPWPGLVGAAAVTLMPEHIRRTNLLFPTALDLALLPFLLLLALKVARGRRYAMAALPAALVALLFVHPWFVALFVPPVSVFLLIEYARRPGKRVIEAAAAGGAAASFLLVVLAVNPIWDPFRMFSRRVVPRLTSLVADPASIAPLPWGVDPVATLTAPAVVLSVAGAVVAAARRRPLGILALAWTLLLFPLTLVDWFGISYIPHRTMAFLATGVAVLAALAVAELLALVRRRHGRTARLAPAFAVALVVLVMLPAAVATPTWYRLYDEDDYAAYRALAALGAPPVEAGSWETRAGYRAMTGGPSEYYPQFFWDAQFREQRIQQHPDLVVVISERTVHNGLPVGFLQDWERIGVWGDVAAYRPPGTSDP